MPLMARVLDPVAQSMKAVSVTANRSGSGSYAGKAMVPVIGKSV